MPLQYFEVAGFAPTDRAALRLEHTIALCRAIDRNPDISLLGVLKSIDEPGREALVIDVECDATILALGGASWPRLGSTGDWLEVLRAQGVAVQPLQAANCGFDAAGRSGSGWTARLPRPRKSSRRRCNAAGARG